MAKAKRAKKKLCFFPILRTQKDPRGDRLYIDWPAAISGTGKIRREYFGPADDPRSRAKYAQARQAWQEERAAAEQKEEAERNARAGGTGRGALIAELVDRYLIHARQRYQKHGKPTGTADNIWRVLKPFLIKYGGYESAYFGLDDLEEYQRELDRAGRLCRKQINARIRIICAMFTWGARHKGADGERLVPPAIAAELRLIENLRRGYCAAKDHPRKLGAPIADIEKAARNAAGPVRAMIRVQLLTGARPGEIRLMRAREITRVSGTLWEYRPESYKTELHDADGERKIIFLGPKSIRIIRPFMNAAENRADGPDYLFRPADGAAERHARSMEIDAQKTPSRRARDAQRAAERKRRYLCCYSIDAYNRAVRRACERAGVPVFTPYQVRKARATEIDRKLGAEAAAIQLGHKSIKTTIDHYIDPRTEQARELARQIG